MRFTRLLHVGTFLANGICMFRFESPLRIYRWGYNAGITAPARSIRTMGFQVFEVSLGHRRHVWSTLSGSNLH